MSKLAAVVRAIACPLINLLTRPCVIENARRSGEAATRAYALCIRGLRSVEGWLKFNPIAVLLLFPLIATPARFAKSQRNGLGASLLAAGALLVTAADYWGSAMQELADVSLRQMEVLQVGPMNEAAKQQFEVYLTAFLGKPMTAAVAATIFLIGCSRAAWYRAFMAVFYQSRKHRRLVGLHYFLVQSASGALYLGALTYGVCFTINNWAWIEQPAHRAVSSGYMVVPVLIFGLLQNRYLKHKAMVDRQLYGSWLVELISTISSLGATVLIGCGVMWLLGTALKLLGAG